MDFKGVTSFPADPVEKGTTPMCKPDLSEQLGLLQVQQEVATTAL